MNTPNKLTVLRIIMVPFFVMFLLWNTLEYNYVWAFLVFVFAALTDAIDGKMARKHNLITDFGKFLDPLADKILVVAALVCFVELNLTSAVIVVIIISREFLVTSLRLVASGSGTVIAASIWGKLKTVSQMIAVVVILGLQAINQVCNVLDSGVVSIIGDVLMIIAATLTVISGIEYLYANRKFIKVDE